MKKKAVILFLSAMLAAGSLTGCGSLDESAVAVSVNDKELTADVANFYARYMQAPVSYTHLFLQPSPGRCSSSAFHRGRGPGRRATSGCLLFSCEDSPLDF